MGISIAPREWRPLAWTFVLVIAASSPAWMGGWVYDDWFMLKNPAMDGAEDLIQAFARTSSDYFKTPGDQSQTGATYRPLSMISLIAAHVLGSETPLLHHLVSLALHMLCVAGLLASLRQRAHAGLAIACSALFALHPMTIEAYGWINGRSDVLAGACLSWLAFALRVPTATGRSASFLLALAAVLSKETALFAVLGLMIAEAMPQRGIGSIRALMRPHGALLLGLAGAAMAIAFRIITVGLGSAGAGAALLSYESQPVTQVLRLWGAAAATVFVPTPRTMQSLAWELSHPMSGTRVILVALLGACLIALVGLRRSRAAVLVSCAAATLIPTLVVSHGFWQGLDRYLYMPAILVLLAVVESDLQLPPLPLRPGIKQLLLGAASVTLGFSTFVSARSYADQGAHFTEMIRMRPEDPTGYLAGAQWLWQAKEQESASELIARMPRDGLPPAIESHLVTVLARMGRVEEALSVLAEMHRRHPDDPFVLYDVFAVAIDRGDFERAFAAEKKLDDMGMFCNGRRALVASVTTKHPEWVETITSARSKLKCN